MGKAPADGDLSPAPLLPGSVFADRYVVRRAIGEGGMGSVYEALDRELDERVALKVLSLSSRTRPGALDRFRREVRMARRVTHANAARTFDIGEHQGAHFLTMELIEGESLAQRLQRERALSPARVVSIGRQICAGLAAVHDAGIVHRDLKPANILIASSGRVVLTDFGIARPMNDDDDLTREGALMVGTPDYMAPEQVAAKPLTAQADLYALGLVLYEMATGRRPFERDTAIATAVARLQEDPEPPQQHATIPQALADAIMVCLRREPGLRPADALAVAAMLGEPLPTASPAPSPTLSTDQTLIAPPPTQGPLAARTGLQPATSTTSPPPPSSVAPGHAPTPPTAGVSTTGTSFASVDVGHRSLAVLPLRYRGPADDAYMAEALTEQLIDMLSMTRGLRVPAAGATERFADHRDPRAVHEALGVDTVVDGTMQRAGPMLRVTIRLLDARTGFQTWTERFDGELEDVFALQDKIAARITETLRLHLESGRYAYSAPAEAVALYMRARVQMRNFHLGGRGKGGAPDLLERCLALAPDFAPAIALYARVCGRMWFLYAGHDPDRDWPVLCAEMVAQAQRLGPDLPDTHLAAARMHTQRGEYGEAARALQHALDLAPTHAAAHGYLGILQCEAGRPKEGLRHIELAVELEPSEVSPLLAAARQWMLAGRPERFQELLDRLRDLDPDSRYPLHISQLRNAMWRRDLEAVEHWRDVIEAERGPGSAFALGLSGYVLGESDEAALLECLARNAPPEASPRYRSMLEQFTIEALLLRGQNDEAMRRLEQLGDAVLVDLEWIQHCPLLEPLLERPELARVRAKVRQRAQAIWGTR